MAIMCETGKFKNILNIPWENLKWKLFLWKMRVGILKVSKAISQ